MSAPNDSVTRSIVASDTVLNDAEKTFPDDQARGRSEWDAHRIVAAALAALAAIALCAAPTAARADWGLRVGGEVPLATHINDGGSYSISDGVQPAIDLLVLKGPSDFIGFGFEGNVGFASTGLRKRTGSFVGPAMIINIPVLPLYARATLPIHLEPGDISVGLRLGAGFKINLPFVGIYLEATADLPFAGTPQKFLGSQVIGVGAGVELRF